MATKSSALARRIQALQHRRRRLLARLLATDEMAVGSVSRVRRRCGNPACHCADGPGHEQMLFAFPDETGKRRCQHVRRQDEPRLELGMNRYREFREALKKLQHLNTEELQLLRAYASARALLYTKDNS